jgi:hypothetical protein
METSAVVALIQVQKPKIAASVRLFAPSTAAVLPEMAVLGTSMLILIPTNNRSSTIAVDLLTDQFVFFRETNPTHLTILAEAVPATRAVIRH